MIGQVIGGYKIVSKLGEGGMGAVYLGEHRRIARRAAIKVLLPDLSDNAEVVGRFFTEARATSMIRHPGIVEILDCDVLPDGNAFIVMEYLEGETASAAIAREGRLPPPRALALVRYVADALAAAHERGIVHRDLKPDNLFLPTAGGGAPAAPIKILDFGIAKLTSIDARGQNMTRTGRLLGTPMYMSPEQCRGARDIDHRSDVYSLGCILFEMVCGRPPFDHRGFGELVFAHLQSPPPSARSLEPSVSPALEQLLARMLAKAPAERPQSLREVVAEIDRITGAPAAPAVITEAYRSGPAPVPAARRMSPAKGRTTLGAAASESLPLGEVEAGTSGGHRPARQRSPLAGPLIALASAAVVVAGVLSWRQLSPRPTPEVATAPAAAPAPPAPAPAPPAAPVPAAAAPPPAPAAAVAAAPPKTEPAPAKSVAGAPRGGSVTVAITSIPPGADVCLAGSRTRIGRTDLDWKTERSSRPTRLLVRKEGYRGEEISFAPERDAKKRIVLHKLGADDLEDTEGCR
jgi:eukaryotic-like serine/threonine-protein kinase